MGEKGKQIECKKDGGQVFLPMAEVMFEGIAVVFKDIVRFIFNFPASAGSLREGNDGL